MENKEMRLAWQFIADTNVSVFLTGRAGTGKTTFLRELAKRTPKRMVVVAPTGVAAINANGVTIHSFFQLPFGVHIPGMKREESNKFYRMGKEKKNLLRTLDLLVIDEISMVRADLLDAVDDVLRKYRNPLLPFGGVQLLLIGDLQQLAPVAREDEWSQISQYYDTPYFFSSNALGQTQYVTIELQIVYRQQQTEFVELLGKIREGRVDDDVVRTLGARYIPGFVPPVHEEWIRLTTHNRMADEYNSHQLELIPSPIHYYRAEVQGNFPQLSYPADEMVGLKVGAQVMFIKNDQGSQHQYYNGKIGRVISLQEDSVVVMCKGDEKPITVSAQTWENMKYTIDEATKEIREEVDGTFTQIPLRLAWAITVHKSQGLTFNHAIVDINDSFAHGQVYVALSRCRTLEGMVLARPLELRSLITDNSVNIFMSDTLEKAKTTESRLDEMRRQYFLTLVSELFNFQRLQQDTEYMMRIVAEHLFHQQPELRNALLEATSRMREGVINVAQKFRLQYVQMVTLTPQYSRDEALQDRIRKGSEYFLAQLHEILGTIMGKIEIEVGNKAVARQWENAKESFYDTLQLKKHTLQYCAQNGFDIRGYLSAKAKALIREEVKKTRTRSGSKGKATSNSRQSSDTSPSDTEKPKRKVPFWVFKKKG